MHDLHLTTTLLALCLGLLLVGYCALLALYWLRAKAPHTNADDARELARWRALSEAYLSSLTEFPDVYTALANLRAQARHGTAVAAQSPNHSGPWELPALRTVLRRARVAANQRKVA